MTRPKRPEGQELRRKFTQAFKHEAVRLAQQREGGVVEVAGELGIRPEMLRAWIRQVVGLPGRPGTTAGTSQDEEIRQLRHELAQVREERDILGKAMAFFARTKR